MPLSADAARVPLARVLLHVVGELPLRWHTAADLDACAGERAPHDWCVMLVSQRVQPGVYTRDALIQSCGPERPSVYQPLIPQILTACYHSILLPPRAFDVHPPVTRDVFYAVALFLQLRTHYPELVLQHRGAGSLLLTPRLDAQATFAKLFADIGREGDVRYAQLDALLKNGLPPPSVANSRHVQALGADLRAETLSHAAGLTSHSTILMYGKSGFLAYHYVVYSADWLLPDALPPLSSAPQDLAAVVRPLEAASWAEVPLAVQIENPRGAVVLLRLTIHWAYCSPRNGRTLAWYGVNRAGAYIRICQTDAKVRLRLPHNGANDVLQDGYQLVLLPRLAFFALCTLPSGYAAQWQLRLRSNYAC